MIKLLLALTTILLAILPAPAELPRLTLIDIKDRKLDVTILEKSDKQVKVRTIKGAYHTIKLDQLSQDSRDLIAALILPNEYLELDFSIQKKDGKTIRDIKYEGQGDKRREVSSGRARTETVSGKLLVKNRHQQQSAEACLLTVYLAGHVEGGGYRLLRIETFPCRGLDPLDSQEFELTPFKNAYHVKGDKTKVGNTGLRYAGYIVTAAIKGKTVSEAATSETLLKQVNVLSKGEPIYPLKK